MSNTTDTSLTHLHLNDARFVFLQGLPDEVIAQAQDTLRDWTGCDPTRQLVATSFQDDLDRQYQWLQDNQAKKRECEQKAEQETDPVLKKRYHDESLIQETHVNQLEEGFVSQANSFASDMLERYRLVMEKSGDPLPEGHNGLSGVARNNDRNNARSNASKCDEERLHKCEVAPHCYTTKRIWEHIAHCTNTKCTEEICVSIGPYTPHCETAGRSMGRDLTNSNPAVGCDEDMECMLFQEPFKDLDAE